MIVGIGIDLVDIPRFEQTLARTPRLRQRLFSTAEQTLKPRSLAARYAAKEALIKALGGSDGVYWTEIEIAPEESGRPWFRLTGSTAQVVADRGITALHLSMSHDAGLASAYVIAEVAESTVDPHAAARLNAARADAAATPAAVAQAPTVQTPAGPPASAPAAPRATPEEEEEA